jgi:hypothetical protein
MLAASLPHADDQSESECGLDGSKGGHGRPQKDSKTDDIGTVPMLLFLMLLGISMCPVGPAEERG